MPDTEDTPTPVLEEPSKGSLRQNEPLVIEGRYTIVSPLGEGGMGKVYKAFDTVLQRNVAVKVLSEGDFTNEHFTRFQQEARAASKFDNPGIVMVFDFGVTDNREPYLVMELVDGVSLDKVLKKQSYLELDEFFRIFLQLTEAMHHAHSKGILHRDLKPSNIMVQQGANGVNARVLDFGIAKFMDDKDALADTRTGVMVGSPRCISPEQAYGAMVDRRTDIYSLGCVMFESLTGGPVFKGTSAMEVIQMHLNNEPDSLSKRTGISFSDELERLISKALSKKVNDRYQSMDELHTALLAVAESVSGPFNELDRIEVEVQPSNSFKILSIAFGAVLMILVGAAYLSLKITTETETSAPQLRREKESSRPYDKWFETNVVAGNEESYDVIRRRDPVELEKRKSLVLPYIKDGRDLECLPLCKNLESLNLCNSNLVTDNSLRKLSGLRKLKYLDIGATPVTPAGLEVFKGNKDLEIVVRNCPAFANQNTLILARRLGVKSIDNRHGEFR